MGVALLGAALLGGLLLLVAAVLLCYLNFSERIYGPLVSVFLGGTVAAIIAVASSLKVTEIERAFGASILFEAGLPAFLPPDPNAPRVSHRLSTLAIRGRPTGEKEGAQVLSISPAQTDSELFDFGLELLQYHIVEELHTLQQAQWSTTQTVGMGVQSAASTRVRVTRTAPVSGDKILRALDGNRFANSDYVRGVWQHMYITLPQGTAITLVKEVGSPESGPDRRTVRLKKPLFFTLDITVQPMIGSGPGSVPVGVAAPQDRLANLRGMSRTLLNLRSE